MRKVFVAASSAAVSLLALMATSITAETPAPPAFSVETTDLGTLLDNPATKAVLTKDVPNLVSNENIQMARGMTLKQVQAYTNGALTDEKLKQIQADLDQLSKQ